ncbi:MAG: O-acetyl-ADP-ribose deacetylase [Candidatus Omnitrophota bacterium]
MGKITIRIGDITLERVDAIVNAANEGLRGGGGVDGAIHRAAGPSVMAECGKIGRCGIGSAIMTDAGALPAKKIIHTVGPVWKGGRSGEPELLKAAYRSSFELAKRSGLKTIAFPAISTGVYGYPIDEATAIAIEQAKRSARDFDEIVLVCFSKRDLDVYTSVAKELGV